MKILFVTREGYIHPGARNRCYNLAHYLLQNKLESKVFSFVDCLKAKAGKEDKQFTAFKKLKYIYKGFNHLNRIINQESWAVVMNRFNYHSIPTYLAVLFNKQPLIFDVDDWELGNYPLQSPNKIYSAGEWGMRFIAKKSLFCLAASHFLYDYLKQFNKNVFFLPTPIDTEIFNFSGYKPKENFIFSWHGSINRQEIVDYLIFVCRCIKLLSLKYPKIKFWIIGDGIWAKKLKIKLDEINSEHIFYRRWVPWYEMPRILADVDVGLIPLLEKTRFNLSKIPVKLLEYMALGRAVVCSPVGEANYIVEEGKEGFFARNQEEFIYKMEYCIKNRDICYKLGENGYRKVQKEFSLSKWGKVFFNLIKEKLNIKQ